MMQAEHEWLEQLAGEWEADVEMHAPGKPPETSTGTETGRMIGGFWAQLENRGEAMGVPFTGILTIGYDPQKRKYVATWVDSMSSHLWQYEGTLDASGKVLTFEAEGPSHVTPGETALYREILEIRDKDHKVFTSMREVDGQWVTGVKIQYSRKE